jgi:hypothetical protein
MQDNSEIEPKVLLEVLQYVRQAATSQEEIPLATQMDTVEKIVLRGVKSTEEIE